MIEYASLRCNDVYDSGAARPWPLRLICCFGVAPGLLSVKVTSRLLSYKIEELTSQAGPGRLQRTRPCLHPLPERYQSASPDPARLLEGGRRNEGARGRRVAAPGSAAGPGLASTR